MIYRF